MKSNLFTSFVCSTLLAIPVSAIAQTYGNGNPFMDNGKSIPIYERSKSNPGRPKIPSQQHIILRNIHAILFRLRRACRNIRGRNTDRKHRNTDRQRTRILRLHRLTPSASTLKIDTGTNKRLNKKVPKQCFESFAGRTSIITNNQKIMKNFFNDDYIENFEKDITNNRI